MSKRPEWLIGYLETAADHVREYYGFHWPPSMLQVLFEDPKGVLYISHKLMGGMIVTVKRDDIGKRYVVRSFKQQFARVKSIQHIDTRARLREKGYINGDS